MLELLFWLIFSLLTGTAHISEVSAISSDNLAPSSTTMIYFYCGTPDDEECFFVYSIENGQVVYSNWGP